MMFYDILWCSMMFYDVLWCSMMFYGVLWCSMMFYDVLWCSMMFYVLRAFLVSFCRSVPPEFLRSFFIIFLSGVSFILLQIKRCVQCRCEGRQYKWPFRPNFLPNFYIFETLLMEFGWKRCAQFWSVSRQYKGRIQKTQSGKLSAKGVPSLPITESDWPKS